MWTMWAALLWCGVVSGGPGDGRGAAKKPGVERRRGKAGKRPFRGKSKSKRGKKVGKRAPVDAAAEELNNVVARVQMQLRRKRYRGVLSETRVALEDYPEATELHIMRAIALAELGDYPSALMRVSDGMGAEGMQVMAVVAEADALRYLGGPDDAVHTRGLLLATGESLQREQVMVMKQFEDHHLHGNLEGMWESATTAMALNPDSAVPYALMSRYFTAMGDPDQAGAYVWLDELRGGRTVAHAIADIEYQLAFHTPESAAVVSDEHRELVLRSKEFAVARGRALLAAGAYDEAVSLVDLQAWRMAGELWHPELLAVEAMGYAGVGWPHRADEVVRRLERTYPELASTRAARAFVDARAR